MPFGWRVVHATGLGIAHTHGRWRTVKRLAIHCAAHHKLSSAPTLVRPVTFVRVSSTPSDRHPEGFVAAWSDFAREKCKAAGAFTWAIPKPNMAKFPAA